MAVASNFVLRTARRRLFCSKSPIAQRNRSTQIANAKLDLPLQPTARVMKDGKTVDAVGIRFRFGTFRFAAMFENSDVFKLLLGSLIVAGGASWLEGRMHAREQEREFREMSVQQSIKYVTVKVWFRGEDGMPQTRYLAWKPLESVFPFAVERRALEENIQLAVGEDEKKSSLADTVLWKLETVLLTDLTGDNKIGRVALDRVISEDGEALDHKKWYPYVVISDPVKASRMTRDIMKFLSSELNGSGGHLCEATGQPVKRDTFLWTLEHHQGQTLGCETAEDRYLQILVCPMGLAQEMISGKRPFASVEMPERKRLAIASSQIFMEWYFNHGLRAYAVGETDDQIHPFASLICGELTVSTPAWDAPAPVDGGHASKSLSDWLKFWKSSKSGQ